MSDLERWRQLFREEAQRCVKELREVIEQDGRGVMARHPIRHLMRLMHTYATCFNILQVSSRSCPIFGVEDMDVVSYCIMLLTSCYIILIVDNIDSDPCQIILIQVACAVAVSEESEGRKGTGPSGPSRARDTRGTR